MCGLILTDGWIDLDGWIDKIKMDGSVKNGCMDVRIYE